MVGGSPADSDIDPRVPDATEGNAPPFFLEHSRPGK